jgi:hypothetical protein
LNHFLKIKLIALSFFLTLVTKCFRIGKTVSVNSQVSWRPAELPMDAFQAQDGHSWVLPPGVFHTVLLLAPL